MASQTFEKVPKKVDELTKVVMEKLDIICPVKVVKVFDQDKEFMDERMHKIQRTKSREYRRRKKSVKYLRLQKLFVSLKLKNSKKYLKEKVELLRKSNLSQFLI